VIPTMILFGLVFGHWWKATLVLAALGWPVLLVVAGVDIEPVALPAAAAFGVVNAGVGVLVHQTLWRLVRGTRAAQRPSG
jgi:hypothetical protein